MSRLIRKSNRKVGLVPGSAVFVGTKKLAKPKITVIDYTAKKVIEKVVKSPEDTFRYKKKSTVTWINVDGLHDASVIEKIGKFYDIHPLVLEDILHTGQRPKIDIYENYIFIVLNVLTINEKSFTINSDQVSLILGHNVVLSFKETEGDTFNPIRDRIRYNKGRVRKHGADYLAYSLLDAIVDDYFIILERFSATIEKLEERLIKGLKSSYLKEMYNLKKEILFLKKSIWPLREFASKLNRNETFLIKKQTEVFFKDLYDHTINVIEIVETSRDLLSGMMDLYMSSASNRMNEVMKVLTIISTIFIPLTFIAGVYGMNFHHMPELDWKYGYHLVWGVMLIVATILLFFFKRKKWM